MSPRTGEIANVEPAPIELVSPVSVNHSIFVPVALRSEIDAPSQYVIPVDTIGATGMVDIVIIAESARLSQLPTVSVA